MSKFKLVSDYRPCGDQPKAIDSLSKGIALGRKRQVLLGVTGSGKTFVMANVIRNTNRPTLIISHNKTLAAQLYSEFKEFFPDNAVGYFVSYYDYYQPEAYIPVTDTYIEKDASINDSLDRLRLKATSALLSRKDVIIVASVSCIYGLGSPEDYQGLLLFMEQNQHLPRKEILKRLVEIQYERNDTELRRGRFRVRGDTIELFPAYEEQAYRIELFADKIEKISLINPLTGKILNSEQKIAIYPAKHFVTTAERIEGALGGIEEELEKQLLNLRKNNKLLEAQRLEQRTKYDMEMLKEVGYCHGIENYSRHLSGRPPGSRPCCLLDYFSDDYLTIIDESHQTIPQIRAMYEGDRARKRTLVEHGFRLPSALDNRPLNFKEFEQTINQVIFVSATPSKYEITSANSSIVEQVVRPTGLIDPEIELRPTEGQIDNLIEEIKMRARRKERVLVTTLTKRLSEDLARYLQDMNVRVKYLHSEVDALHRVRILRELRLRKFDALVGINLLREGLDLPEVSLVAILDADKEGFLRSEVSLIQTAGRAARNINGRVIMYADTVTGSMKKAITETKRRRKIQLDYNQRHGITPKGIKKAVREEIVRETEARKFITSVVKETEAEYEIRSLIADLERQMSLAARNLQFEKAARFRDDIAEIKRNIEQ